MPSDSLTMYSRLFDGTEVADAGRSHDARAVNPNKAGRIESPFERSHRFTQEPAPSAAMQLRIIARCADPLQVVETAFRELNRKCGFDWHRNAASRASFGKVERVWQFAIVVAVWAVELAISPIWLRHFFYGPLEWLWRTLTYWQPMPFRRRAVRESHNNSDSADRSRSISDSLL